MIEKRICSVIFMLLYAAATFANSTLKEIQVVNLPGSAVQVVFNFEGKLPEVKDFFIKKPKKIILDFLQTDQSLPKDQQQLTVEQGFIRKITTIATERRSRSVLDLQGDFSYEVTKKEQSVILTLKAAKEIVAPIPFSEEKQKVTQKFEIKVVDFKRGDQGDGQVLFQLSDPYVPIILKEEGNVIRLRFQNTTVNPLLERQLEVTDFATPVQFIETKKQGNDVWVVLKTQGEIDTLAYQADKQFTVEVRKKSEKTAALAGQEVFTGERISLNFQNIEVRSVLQLIAEFTGLNVVASDSVSGNVTLRLRNVPWGQALSIILKTKGLAKRQLGDILLVGPSEEVAAREKQELEASQQVRDLAPLHSEFIQINYAKAQEMATLLKDEKNSLMSSRGNVTLDGRTNTLLVQDTVEKIEEIRTLIKKLDVPVRQVLIESRVVVANDDFDRALGVKFGTTFDIRKKPKVGFAQNVTAANTIVQGSVPSSLAIADRLNVNLPSTLASGNGQFGLTIGRLPGGTILDLELSALESEGLGKIISSPRLVTSNQQKAFIESGVEIPYPETSPSGATTIAFKKAVLRLEVEPQITPDDRIVLDLAVNQDSKGDVVNNIPAINTQKIRTNVLVDNGETVVLGGIYTQNKKNIVSRVPVLGRLPGIGWLFRNEKKEDHRNELMIFVTPKIIHETAW